MFNSTYLDLFKLEIININKLKFQYNLKLNKCCQRIKQKILKNRKNKQKIQNDSKYIQLLILKTHYINLIHSLKRRYSDILHNNISKLSYAEQFNKLPNLNKKHIIANKYITEIKISQPITYRDCQINIEISYCFPDLSKTKKETILLYRLKLYQKLINNITINKIKNNINPEKPKYEISLNKNQWICTLYNSKNVLIRKYNFIDLLDEIITKFEIIKN